MRPPLRPPDDPDSEPLSAAPADTPPTPAETPAAVSPADPPTDLLGIIDPLPQVETINNPFGLNQRELLFVEAYTGVAAGHAAQAYEIAGYKTTGASSRANASRMLTRPRIEAAIAARIGERIKRIRIMDGEEALEGISQLARSDIRKAFPPNHPIAQLPDDIAACIKAVRPGKHGYTIELYDKGHHLEVMAKVTGKLKETVKVEHTLEDILARANEPPDSGASA